MFAATIYVRNFNYNAPGFFESNLKIPEGPRDVTLIFKIYTLLHLI